MEYIQNKWNGMNTSKWEIKIQNIYSKTVFTYYKIFTHIFTLLQRQKFGYGNDILVQIFSTTFSAPRGLVQKFQRQNAIKSKTNKMP